MPVYLVRAGESGPVKIGWAADVRSRLSKMQADNHEMLRLLRVWEGGEVEETALHLRFADLLIRGEWFSFSRLMLGDVGLDEAPLPDPVFEETGNKIADWLGREKVTLTAFSLMLGVPITTAHGWVHGRRMPPIAVVAKIETLTNGQVRASDFVREKPQPQDAA